jgi:hypothetical protein
VKRGGLWGMQMANEAKAHILRTKEGKYIMYIPAKLSDDSMFPFKGVNTTPIKISFKNGKNELLIEKL